MLRSAYALLRVSTAFANASSIIGKMWATSSRSDCFSRSERVAYGVTTCLCQCKANRRGRRKEPSGWALHWSKRYFIHLAQLACSLSANCSIISSLFIALPLHRQRVYNALDCLHRCHIRTLGTGLLGLQRIQLLFDSSELVTRHVELRLCAVEVLDMRTIDNPRASWRVYDMVWVIAPYTAFKLLIQNLRMIFRVHLRLIILWQADIRQGIGTMSTPV